MPKLWSETIEAHRHAVREATLDAAAALVADQGLRAVTMSQIAARTGIGRATLYKYFPDVDAILGAWHERQVSGHLEQLAVIRDGPGNAGQRLEAVLESYALAANQHHGSELSAILHRGEHVANARRELTDFVEGLLVEGVHSGELRDDVAPGELATYCLHALAAADRLRSADAVRRLVMVTMAGLRQTPGRDRRPVDDDRRRRIDGRNPRATGQPSPTTLTATDSTDNAEPRGHEPPNTDGRDQGSREPARAPDVDIEYEPA